MSTQIKLTSEMNILQDIQNDKLRYHNELEDLQKQLANTELFKKIEWMKIILKEFDTKLKEKEQVIIDSMLSNWVKKIDFEDKVITAKKSPWAVVIQDESLLPDEYIKKITKTQPNKVLIKEALKENKSIPWAQITYNYSLLIKSKD